MGDPLEFAQIGTQFSLGDPAGSEGYDGQFVYYIASDPDPERAKILIDVPAYRYQRILLPFLARALSLGNVALIAWMLPLIGLVAHTSAVFLLSKLLEAWKVSRWYALSYGLWVGLLLALRLDLPETLALGLIIAAVFLEHRGKSGASWFAFGLALFAKETTLFFLAALLLVYLLRGQWRKLIGLSLVAVIPFALFQFWLYNTFGQFGLSSGGLRATPMEWIPFMGIWRLGSYDLGLMIAFLAIYLPTLVVPALWGLRVVLQQWKQGELSFTASALLLNALIFPFLPFSLYSEPFGAFRFSSGLVLAILLFAARHKHSKVLNYSLFWLALNVIILGDAF